MLGGRFFSFLKRAIRTTTTSDLWSMRTESPFPLPLVRTETKTSLFLRASSRETAQHYLSFSRRWRLGKLLEDLDALAGTVAYRHCDDGDGSTTPPQIVTACVDRVRVSSRRALDFREDGDLELRGRVAHVGSSTMQIEGDVVDAGTGEVLVTSLFVMAARENGKPWKRVPRLERETASMLSGRPVPTGESFSTQWVMGSTWLTEPQDKNLSGNVFGGVLIRKAVELAQATAMVHLGQSAGGCISAIEQVNFFRPVPVGAVVIFSAKLGKESGSDSWQVMVETEVLELNSNERFHSHTFHILL